MKKVTKVRKPTNADTLRTSVEQAWAHNDSRVIARTREVLAFELAATEDHLNGLAASTAEVKLKKARLEAKIAGLTAVLSKRLGG